MQVSQSYGITRPAAIAAKIAALQARAFRGPVAIEAPAPIVPTLALVPEMEAAPVCPGCDDAAKPHGAEYCETCTIIKATRDQIVAWQAERAGIRADLPFLRHYAANFDDGPTVEEIEALESRLADLDDFLIFEDDTFDAAQTFDALLLAA
jgi:hypothetical protein